MINTHSKLRIIVTGLVGLYPVGGVAWDYLQYLIGLSRLGHDVYYHEDTWSWPYQPVQRQNSEHGQYSVDFIHQFLSHYAPELIDHWHYWHLHKQSYGMSFSEFNKIAQSADLFINVSGNCFIPDCLSSHCTKIFLDTDPGYNQIMLSERLSWSENIDRWCQLVDSHDQYFTYAENINNQNCLVPRLNYAWQTTRMPVVLDLWENPAVNDNASMHWSTIMTWNAFKGKLIYKGIEYQSKGAEFDKFKELPLKKPLQYTIAVGGKDAPLDVLKKYGWIVIDGPEATRTPEQYQNFIVQSKGEFSTAKNVYVAMKTGWFSCRSACYLAAGKPVVVQNTGFSHILPTESGILTFATMDEAINNIRMVDDDYGHHASCAKDIANEYFDANKVLTKMIEKVFEVTNEVNIV